jgi:beta-galactosidase
MPSRRKFLTNAGALAAGALGATALPVSSSEVEESPRSAGMETVSLCGEWWFRVDPDNAGRDRRWFDIDTPAADWSTARVPHTWQIQPPWVDYRGVAWYRRQFDVPVQWSTAAVRVEFEAVFHSATVWVNGQPAGEHLRKGYTAFAFDITQLLRRDTPNTIAVRVDNTFNEHMLPRGRSSDWAHDGGIVRPVQLLITPRTFIEGVDVEAIPDLTGKNAKIVMTAYCRNTSATRWTGNASFRVVEEQTGLIVLSNFLNNSGIQHFSIEARAAQMLTLHATLPNAKLWHLDHPNLYRLEFLIADERESDQFTTTFGVRKFEIQDGGFYLNGERVRLMGVERMAGSNPAFGMAEPPEWIVHDHDEMKHLNCIFTRVHWPQDKRVLDYCDRHGILMQSEVPAWGPDTFKNMSAQPDADIMENGVEQLGEMIRRDRNHPSIVAWGLCNEIDGQNPPAYQFAKRMLEEAKRLDPSRPCSYASHSLLETPQRDVAGLMDFIEINEYFGSWSPGTPADLSRHLDEVQATFPGKPIVVSEYGYCACTDDRPEGDVPRIGILRSHDAVIRSKFYIGGAIFFCYNDYRTHVGDRGVGALQQRVHGVVDLLGAHKPSYDVLRQELSPIESLTVENQGNIFNVHVRARRDLPAYTLRNFKLRAIFYGQGNIPVAQQEVGLPDLAPGNEAKLELSFSQPETPLHVRFDALRPTNFSAYSLDWK